MDNRKARKANQVGLEMERRANMSECEEMEDSMSEDEMHIV